MGGDSGTACGPNGVGVTMVAPGDPVPGVRGTAAVACGAMRPRACAQAGASGARTNPTAATTPTQMRKTFKSHPNVRLYLGLNHGNFMPRPVPQAGQTTPPDVVCS
jgi:hypothetical protein